MSRIHPLLLTLPRLALIVLIASCGPSVPSTPTLTATPAPAPTATQTGTPPTGAVNLAPFKELARTSSCADIRNRLFVIDNQLVFWDVAGNCADASYSQMLYGSTPDQMLCIFHDSIAGPKRSCQDERYKGIFDTITANLNKADLGLGPGHTVQPVPR